MFMAGDPKIVKTTSIEDAHERRKRTEDFCHGDGCAGSEKSNRFPRRPERRRANQEIGSALAKASGAK
jgi:hypothetical protein